MNGSVIWKSGWYASRLHAVADDTVFPDGRLGEVKSLCGQFVYRDPPTDWAKRYAEKAPHCKRCERIVSQNAGRQPLLGVQPERRNMGLALYIQPGDQRPGGKPAGRINVAHGAKPRHVDEAIAAGVNMISLKLFRWRDAWKHEKLWASNCDIDRVEGRLSELGWTRWSVDRNCWLPPNAEGQHHE